MKRVELWISMIRDVNGAGRVRVVVPPYPTRWINICLVPVSISVGYPLCVTSLFFNKLYYLF